MKCAITDTGLTLDCSFCGRSWHKLPPTGAPNDCFPMLAARVRQLETTMRNVAGWLNNGCEPSKGAAELLLVAGLPRSA